LPKIQLKQPHFDGVIYFNLNQGEYPAICH